MFETNSFYLKETHKSEEVMSGKREFCVAQLIGVFLFCFGLAGGILIGIYLYHGGPDSEVSCKNLPDWLKNGDKTTSTLQTTVTYGPTTPKTDCINCNTEKRFTYTINNQLREPFFNNSVTMEIVDEDSALIDYMERAVDQNKTIFTKFTATYFSGLGYFIESINNVSGTYAVDKSYWEIRTQTGPTTVGVSSFIPTDGVEVLFNLTISSPANEHN
ncbi:uncharacterized protein LOC132743030 [Ruditapes philippinarum]|uniref:uncharacterized protein LOC132743030 n=1 Tax=Ruditapes philippinarum TaxID=129788 RepID=UPI00295B2EC8|nr:uncharacterized protein LOC132743030 [Ruditapes philippinarum]